MKKKILLSLFCSLCFSMLSACGNEESAPESILAPTQTATGTTDGTVPVQAKIPATTPESTTEPTAAPTSTPTTEPTSAPTSALTAEPTATPAPIEGYTERESEAIRSVLNQRIVYKTDKVSSVSIWVDSTCHETGTPLGSFYLPKNSVFQSLDVSSDIKALKMDDREWLAVTIKATILTDGKLLPYEEDFLEVMIPVTRTDDGKITLGEYYPNPSYAYTHEDNRYREGNYIRTRLNLLKADLTHDGVDDYIETFVFFPPEADLTADINTLVQTQMLVDEIRVHVYDGSTATAENFGSPIWAGGFSAAHAGNGQLSVVCRDGLYYLLNTDVYMGMEAWTSYSYQVIALDNEGHLFIIDQYDTSFYGTKHSREDAKQFIASFREHLTPWLSNGQLIVAADVDLERKKQMYTTERKEYIPEDFYNIIWERWDL